MSLLVELCAFFFLHYVPFFYYKVINLIIILFSIIHRFKQLFGLGSALRFPFKFLFLNFGSVLSIIYFVLLNDYSVQKVQSIFQRAISLVSC